MQLDRQLAALKVIEEADDDGPLAPLRALLGLRDLTCLQSSGIVEEIALEPDEQIFDPSQIACVPKALSTPHFALIHGPPGSGKTTVISSIVQRAIARFERVLVVSPTHVAVDNVVEKVTAMEGKTDRLDEVTLPVRDAARAAKVSPAASPYWVGSKRQRRAATVSNRLKDRLIASVDFAAGLYAQEDIEAREKPPLSAALAAIDTPVCGTPIGVLSYEPVKESPPAGFGVVIVDEVSKMTLPEFLAIAVKAKRWVLVGCRRAPAHARRRAPGPAARHRR